MDANETASSALEKNRSVEERRVTSWRTVLYGFLRSRRRDTRRITETPSLYSDWHHPWLFFLATGTMLLSCLDAFFTLELLGRGFYESNPLMANLLGHGTRAFAVSKMSLTGFGVLTLVYLSRARFLNLLRTGLMLTLFFSFYACLVCYEFVWLIRQL